MAKASRSDKIGAACAVLAIAAIAWLSVTSWKMADCREMVAKMDRVGHISCSPWGGFADAPDKPLAPPT